MQAMRQICPRYFLLCPAARARFICCCIRRIRLVKFHTAAKSRKTHSQSANRSLLAILPPNRARDFCKMSARQFPPSRRKASRPEQSRHLRIRSLNSLVFRPPQEVALPQFLHRATRMSIQRGWHRRLAQPRKAKVGREPNLQQRSLVLCFGRG